MRLVKKKKILFKILFILLIFFSINQKTKAEGMDFLVEAILPENQVDSEESYFDLKVEPEKQQDLSFRLINLSEKQSIITIKLNPGWTNQNGVLSYSNMDKKIDESMEFPITDLISESEKKIKLEPLEEKIVSFTLKTPKRKFDGVIVGGFVFKKEKEDDLEGSKTSEVIINNDIQLVKGIQLSETENSVSEKINIKSAKAGIINYRNAFILNFQNPQPRFIRDISVQMTIKKQNSGEVLVSEEKKISSMAPNSNVDLPVMYEEEIKPGKYVMEINLITNELKKQKELNFEVTKKEYKEIKKELIETTYSDKKNNYYWVMTIIVLAIIILCLIIFLFKIWRKKK